jgi:hypothetical protein
MSSTPSIDSPGPVRLKPDTTAGAPKPDITLHTRQLFALAGLIGATVVVFVSRGQTPAGLILLSLTIFAAATLGVAAWRMLAPLTGRSDLGRPQMLGGRTRAALEREKTLALRSIKELEFDRAMGKVSDKDFADMSVRLRSRAASLIRQLDAGAGYRDAIEREIARRLGSGSREQDPPSAFVGRVPRSGPAEKVCVACGQGNDADARFCKHCGARMERTE